VQPKPFKDFTGLLESRFALGRLLGLGGFCAVSEAVDRETGKKVAVKLLSPKWEGNQNAVALVCVEADALASITHPSVPSILGASVYRRPYFLVTDFVGLRSLDRSGECIESLHDLLILSLKIADALEATHAAGVIHRDVKPENLLAGKVNGSVEAVVIDYGCSRVRNGRLWDPYHCTSVGTKELMPPEQRDGGQYADERSDIYSFGRTMQELLVKLLRRVPVVMLACVEAIIDRATQKSPEQRFQSMTEMKRAIGESISRLRAN